MKFEATIGGVIVATAEAFGWHPTASALSRGGIVADLLDRAMPAAGWNNDAEWWSGRSDSPRIIIRDTESGMKISLTAMQVKLLAFDGFDSDDSEWRQRWARLSKRVAAFLAGKAPAPRKEKKATGKRVVASINPRTGKKNYIARLDAPTRAYPIPAKTLRGAAQFDTEDEAKAFLARLAPDAAERGGWAIEVV